MSENLTPAINDAVSADTGALAPDASTVSAEDFFELQHGKNPDGTPVTKRVTREEMIRLAQLGFGANNTFEEAKQTKAQIAAFTKMLADPEMAIELLRRVGHDPDELFMSRYHKQALENAKSPEEKEYEALQRDAEEWRKEKSRREEEEQTQRVQQRATQIQQTLFGKIEAALSAAGMPQTKSTVAEVGRYIKTLAEKMGDKFDLENLPVEQIVAHVGKSRQSAFTTLLDELDDAGIGAMLTPEQKRKLGKALAAGLESQGLTPVQQPISKPTEEKPGKKKYITMDESRGGVGRFGKVGK